MTSYAIKTNFPNSRQDFINRGFWAPAPNGDYAVFSSRENAEKTLAGLSEQFKRFGAHVIELPH